MKKNLIFILFGVSGVGKTYLQHYLKKQYNIQPIITHTTRKPRQNEKNGIDYHFNTVKQFKNLDLMEYTKYDHNYYGSAMNDIKKAWSNGHHWLSLVLDYKGVQAYMKRLPDNIIPIYLFTNTQEVINRLQGRKMNKADIKERLNEHQGNLNKIYKTIFNNKVKVYTLDTTMFKHEREFFKEILK